MEEPVVQINIGKVTIIFILACLILFFFPQLKSSFSFSWTRLPTKPWSVITNAFFHADLAHLGYNLLSLFFLGNVLELHRGSRLVFLVLVLGIVFGNLGFAIFEREASSIGISGGVFGLIGAVMVLMPRQEILLPLFGISVKAKAKIAAPLIAFGEFFMSFVTFDNIAHAAHFFGLLAGAVIAYYIRRREVDEFDRERDEFIEGD